MFGKRSNGGKLKAPFSGKAVALTEVPDPVFSGLILGNGAAVIPEGDTAVSPCDGKIINIADTLHAYGIETKDGFEVLVHIGLNTVELNGEGFECLVKEGQKVKSGDPLCRSDLELIRSKGYETYTPVVITNSDDAAEIKSISGDCTAGETVIAEYK